MPLSVPTVQRRRGVMTLSVSRKLRFAWLEYQDPWDGVAFDRAMTRYGWRNLFLDLAPMTPQPRRVDLGHPDLRIRWFAGGKPDETALIAAPGFDHADFLGKWMLNPGVDQNFRLTFGNDYADQADLLAISGHGIGGMVSGTASGASPAGLAILKHIANIKGKKPGELQVSGRLKYLLIPACTNVGVGFADEYLPALHKRNPIHGILGYSDGYPGGSKGAWVMQRFAKLLHEPKGERTILQAWKEANEGLRWGAVLFASSAASDTMAKWRSDKGLPLPDHHEGAVLHFDPDSYPVGVPITKTTPQFEAFFHMSSSIGDTKISRENQGDNWIGLFPEHRGYILIPKNGDNFVRGDVLRLVFGKYRLSRGDMDLDTLLKFDPGQPITFIKDGNPRKPYKPGKVDTLDCKLLANTSELKLWYTVRQDAQQHYRYNREVGDPFFFFVIFPPRADWNDRNTWIWMIRHGAHLRGQATTS